MKTGYIYKIERKKTGQLYIGQTTRFEERMTEHKRGTVQYIDRAIQKYGENAFIYTIIEEVPIKQLNEREKYYIKKYNTYNNSFHYNNHPGGDALGEVTEEHKEKLSTKLKEFFSTSPEKHPSLEISKKEVSTIIYDYMKKDLNSIEIANKHNICARTIRKVLNGNHLINQTNLKYLKLRALAKNIIYYYEELDLSYKEISQKINRGRNFIGKIATRKHQITKGLGPPIEKSQYRLSEDDYLQIFNDYYNGKYNQEELANKYNVTSSTISKIVNGKHSISELLGIKIPSFIVA